MADNVVKLYPANSAENPDNVLEQAIGNYSDVLIIGWGKDGDFDPRASLGLKAAELLWLVELFKSKLVGGTYMDDEE